MALPGTLPLYGWGATPTVVVDTMFEVTLGVRALNSCDFVRIYDKQHCELIANFTYNQYYLLLGCQIAFLKLLCSTENGSLQWLVPELSTISYEIVYVPILHILLFQYPIRLDSHELQPDVLSVS